MKKITLLVTETATYRTEVEVPDEWTTETCWEQEHLQTPKELWLKYGDPSNDFVAVVDRWVSVEGDDE